MQLLFGKNHGEVTRLADWPLSRLKPWSLFWYRFKSFSRTHRNPKKASRSISGVQRSAGPIAAAHGRFDKLWPCEMPFEELSSSSLLVWRRLFPASFQ